MQISTQQLYARSAAQMSDLSARADTLQTQIATGKKIAAPSDDPLAYRRLEALRQGVADDTAWSANIDLATSLLAQTDTTLGSIETQLQRAAELAVQANSDVLSAGDRRTIATQVRGVLDDLVALANSTDLRGQPLFAAATGDSAVVRASDGTFSYGGSGDPAAIPIGEGADIRATESAERVFGNIFATLKTFAEGLESGGGSAAAATAGDAIKTSLGQVTNVRGSVGARAARLDLEAARLSDTQTDREVARSTLEDTDVTAAITELQKTMTILSATQASFTRLSQLSLFDYLR